VADRGLQPQALLARWPNPAQVACGMVLGALAGLYGCGMLYRWWAGSSGPWVASGFCRRVLASALVAALVWRAKARTPADTAARLTELQARIRPHFLFNTLNSAIALVRADPARAEALLEDLSDLFRHALIDQGESVTLARRSRWPSATWRSSRCALASGCRSNGRWTRRPAAPACRPCCCSRWWRTPSSMAWSPANRRADPHQHAAPRRQWW
jgi:hypothetical protein